jgi:hypothetical protein
MDVVDDECPHFTVAHHRGKGSHTCLDCGQVVSVDMSHDLGVGNQWSGAGGRPSGKQNLTAKVMLKEMASSSSSSEPPARSKKDPKPAIPKVPKVVKVVVPKVPKVVKDVVPKVPKVVKDVVSKVPKVPKAPPKPKETKPKPLKQVALPAASLPPPKPVKVPKATTAKSHHKKLATPLTRPHLTTKPVAIHTPSPPLPHPPLQPLPPPHLLPLPPTVLIPPELHAEADRLFRALGKVPGKVYRSHTRLAFACTFNAAERLGIPRSATVLADQFFQAGSIKSKRNDCAEALAEFTALCPHEERLAIMGRDVAAELRSLLVDQHRYTDELVSETMELLTGLVAHLSKASPMFDPHDEPQQGRKRLALGLLQYWDCYLEPDRAKWPVIPDSRLFPAEDVIAVVREVDRCQGKELFG